MVDDPTDVAPTPDQARTQPRWCLVGNVVAQRLHGEDGELRQGAKQFPGGTKVYYASAYWGMGAESVTVLGLSRRPRRWITTTVRSSLIENWRAKLVFAPRVLQELQDHDIHGDQGEARTLADVMNRISTGYSRRLVARAPQECRQAADDARATILPGQATSTEDEDPDENRDENRDEEHAFVFYLGTQAVAGLVYRAAPATSGARGAAPFTWRHLWVRPVAQRVDTDTGAPVDHRDGTAAAFRTALQARFPWHDLTALHAELTARHT